METTGNGFRIYVSLILYLYLLFAELYEQSLSTRYSHASIKYEMIGTGEREGEIPLIALGSWYLL